MSGEILEYVKGTDFQGSVADSEYGRPETISSLPPEISTLLAEREYTPLLHKDETGTRLIARIPEADIERLKHSVPQVLTGYALYDHPSAPVLRASIYIFDHPARPLILDLLVNPSTSKRKLLRDLAGPGVTFPVSFYDKQLTPRHVLRVPSLPYTGVREVIELGHRLVRMVPINKYDYERATADILATYPLLPPSGELHQSTIPVLTRDVPR